MGGGARPPRSLRRVRPIARFADWCIDAVDADAVASFWAAALGLDARPHPHRDVVGLWRGDVPVVWVNRVDSPDPVPLAAWWAGVLGARIGPGPDGTPRYLHDLPGTDGLVWKAVPVDDERVGDNRVHWDVVGDADALEAAGATVVRRPDGDIPWTVLRDPQGNVFCAHAPEP